MTVPTRNLARARANQRSGDLRRTILYYPTISIPSGPWLRQALFYWDEIASIVPRHWQHDTLDQFSPETEFLSSQNLFREIRPEILIQRPEFSDFVEEFELAVSSQRFRRLIPLGSTAKCESRIHRDKLSMEIMSLLKEQRLAVDSNEDDWFLFERNTALLYMSLLAKHLARIDSQATSLGTDRSEYEGFIFDAQPGSRDFACLDVRFHNVLPVPSPGVPFEKIIDFKRKYSSELLHFRERMDVFQRRLHEATNETEIGEISVGFKEDIERGVRDLHDSLRDHRSNFVWGSLKTLVSVKSPSLWVSLLAASGSTSISKIPLDLLLPGVGIMALIEVGKHYVNERAFRHGIIRDSVFAYLYHAEKEQVSHIPFSLIINFTHELRGRTLAARDLTDYVREQVSRLRRGDADGVELDKLAHAVFDLDQLQGHIDSTLDMVIKAADQGFPLRASAPIDYNELLKEIERVLPGLAHCRRDVTIRVDRESFGRPGYRDLYVDLYLLRSMVVELVSNAVKYSVDQSVVEVRCGISSDRGPQFLVTNSGARLQHMIFQRGWRSEETQQYSGHGLGLWLIDALMRSIGGEVRVSSERRQKVWINKFTLTFYNEEQ